jgi:two-component system, NarL family, response regulator YdfI
MPTDLEITPQLEALLETLTLLAEQARLSEQALPVDQVQARLSLAVLERLAQQAANEASDLLAQLQSTPAPSHPLTPREMEVLCLASEGLTNKEIAYRLGLSERTIQFHLNSVYVKTGSSSRTEATALAFKRGWL